LYGIEVVMQIEVLMAQWVSVLFYEEEEGGAKVRKRGAYIVSGFWRGIFWRV
jgi:hypothetical protein